ncbi:1-aminocyclopropane-1-carboxylate synthase [Aureococcus anophagefferens]|nr:1-aminocyclopropane-1-carboxylate synthase [Aureococcus anophagefferens]
MRIEMDKVRMMDKLAIEKNQFDEMLQQFEVDVPRETIQREVEIWWKQSYKLKGQLEETTPGAADCAGKLREERQVPGEPPLIQALASPALKERHWSNLSDKIGQKITPYDDHGVELTLHSLLEMSVGSYIEEIQETMCGSMFIKAIEEDAKAWESQLKYAQALIDEWIACQRVWMYLEPIFGSEDIMRQLPTEARRFNDVDKLWRATMKATEEDPVFIAQADPRRSQRASSSRPTKLDKIQKGLSDYLEMKRLFFPRFFFLADEQMLEILRVIATSAIFWASGVNKTIETGGYAALNEYVLELNKGLTAIVMLVRGQLSKLQRKTPRASSSASTRATCVSMATAQVDKVSDFNWQSQLRYYWEPSWKDGQACVVFNCSDGLDYKAMAKFFKGLAGCGSWCCFDEFNRINVGCSPSSRSGS